MRTGQEARDGDSVGDDVGNTGRTASVSSAKRQYSLADRTRTREGGCVGQYGRNNHTMVVDAPDKAFPSFWLLVLDLEVPIRLRFEITLVKVMYTNEPVFSA